MLNLEKLTKDQEKEWDVFVDTHSEGLFEHKMPFIKFLQNNGKAPRNFLIKDKKIMGLISLTKEKKAFFTRYASQGLLISQKENKNKIIDLIKQITKDANYLRINNIKNAIRDKTTPITFILNCKDLELKEIFDKKLESRARRAIKKAIKNKLQIKISNSEKELEEFYKIYTKKMKEYGTIPYSLESLKELIKNKEYKIFNIYHENKIIAGGTMIVYKKRITNHLAASNKEFLKFSPNNFLYYSMIKFAKENDLETINYGPSLESDRVAKFKISMGGMPSPIEEHIVINNFSYKLFKLASFIILKLKKVI
jgi:lipid II:glycine glycyltransferase (peptidoglycan interpeptide bridge formation enzyme)